MLRIGSRNFLVPPEIGELFAGPEALSETTAALAKLLVEKETAKAPPPTRVWMWLRLSILPRKLVRKLAGRLMPLCGFRLLAAQGLGGLGLIAWFLSIGFSDPSGRTLPSWPLALTLFLVSALWHELGHAAALAREGYPPGVVGVGVLLVIPVLYSDVTAVAALNRLGKTRVNLGGICFHLAAGGSLALAGWAIHLYTGRWPTTLLLAEFSILAAVAWSLTPFFRSDGYWLLADLLGLSDLEQPLNSTCLPVTAFSTRLLAGGLVLYRLAHAAFLTWVGFLLPLRYAAKLQALERWLPDLLAGTVARMVLGLLVLLLWLGVGRRILTLFRSCWLDLLVAFDYHPQKG